MKQATRHYPDFRSPCPVASGLDLFGDKWERFVEWLQDVF